MPLPRHDRWVHGLYKFQLKWSFLTARNRPDSSGSGDKQLFCRHPRVTGRDEHQIHVPFRDAGIFGVCSECEALAGLGGMAIDVQLLPGYCDRHVGGFKLPGKPGGAGQAVDLPHLH